MKVLEGWYPGLGEVETIRRMSPLVREFLCDAAAEDPDFLHDYILPTIEGYPDPEEKILSDLSGAIMAYELSESGLGSYEENLGNLGKSFFKRAVKAVRKVQKKIIKTVAKAHRQVVKGAGRVWKKYGKIILMVVGTLLTPFVGPVVLLALSAVTAADTYYRKKRAADQAKQAARRDAGQLAAEADKGRAEAEQSLNDFYNKNQQWFIDQLGVTPDKWAQLTLEEKTELLRSGLSGKPPSGTPVSDPGTSQQPTQQPVQEPVQQPSQQPPGGGGGGGYAPPSGGGGGGGGSGYPEGTSSSGFVPYGQQHGRPEVAQAGMFSGNAIPLLAAGVALALVFGKSVKGGRTRKNPRRRHRRVA